MLKHIQYFFNTFVFFILMIQAGNAQDFWQPTNGPNGATVECFAQNMSGDIFVGLNWLGIYRSSDEGNNWLQCIDDSSIGGVRDLKINSRGYIYAISYGINIFRSIDNGNSWHLSNNGFTNSNFSCLAINDQDHIYAGTSNGLYKSEDDGNNWFEITVGQYNSITAIAINQLGHIFVGIRDGGIYRSMDNGQTWRNVDMGIQYTVVYEIKIDELGYIYAATGYRGNIRSKDNGQTWQNLGLYLANTFEFNYSGRIFAATNSGVYYSNNRGSTWTKSSGLVSNATVNTLLYSKNAKLFAGMKYSGIIASEDDGSTWQLNNKNIIATNVTSLYSDVYDKIYAGTVNAGIQFSNDCGDTWNHLGNTIPLNLKVTSIKIIRNDNIILGTFDKGILKSADNGNSWSFSNTGITDSSIKKIEITNTGRIFVGTSKTLYYSDNDGDFWNSTGITGNAISNICINDSNHIYVGTSGNYVYCSKDNGINWTNLNIGLQYPYILSMTIDGNNHIYVSAYDIEEPTFPPFPNYYYGIFKSIDYGNNWVLIKDNLRLYNIIVDKEGVLYGSAFQTGIYRSLDNGITWNLINSGIPTLLINNLMIDINGYIYAGTYSSGIYKSAAKVTTVNDEVTKIPRFPMLHQNYPNPFNSTTIIPFELPQKSHVELAIYDITGKKIKTLVSGEYNIGVHNISWDGTNQIGQPVSSGVYIYNLKAIANNKTYNKSAKLILLQ